MSCSKFMVFLENLWVFVVELNTMLIIILQILDNKHSLTQLQLIHITRIIPKI